MAFPVVETQTYPSDTALEDWLDNPFEVRQEQWKNVQGEYTVEQLNNGMYGVRMVGVSEELDSGVSIAVVPSGGGSALTQSPQLIKPSSGEFRPDWQKFTGIVEFNRSQLGDSFVIKYVSSGSAVTTSNLSTAIDDLIGATDTRTFGGDVVISGILSVIGATKSLANPGYATLTSGLVLQWGLQLNATAGVSQTWPKPFSSLKFAYFMLSDNTQQQGSVTLDINWNLTSWTYVRYMQHVAVAPYHILGTSPASQLSFISLGI